MTPAKVVTCQPSMVSDTLSSCQYLLAHISLQFFVWFVGSLALIGNIFVIILNCCTKDNNVKVHILLINNLAISDLIMSIYLFIIASANLIYGNGQYGQKSEEWLRNPLCVISCILVTTSSLVSVFLMVVISIDRFMVIVYMFKVQQLSIFATKVITSIIWVVSFAFALVPGIFSLNKPGYLRLYTYNSMCMPSNYKHYLYRIWMMSYIFITMIAWIITGSLYVTMFISIRNTRKAAGKLIPKDSKLLAIRLSVILLTDLLSWVPYYVVNNFGFVFNGNVDVISLQFVGILALPINSALNPFLYTITSGVVFKILFVRPATYLADLFTKSTNENNFRSSEMLVCNTNTKVTSFSTIYNVQHENLNVE